MGIFSSWLHPERGYDKAMQELKKYYEQAQQYQQPYIEHGEDAYKNISPALLELLNPEQLHDKWSQGYKESDYAKQLESEAMDRGLNSAQSMGLGGSSSALQALQGGTQKIVNQERQQYLDDLMKKYLSGVGLGQNIYNTGAGAAGTSSNIASNMGSNAAQLAFNKQNAPGNLLNNLIQGAVSFATPIGQAYGMNKLGLDKNAPWSTTGSGSTTGRH